jgi:hypothetical protein
LAEQFQLLNVEAHRSLKMRADVKDHPPFVMITIGEFPAAAAVCPIFFAKDKDTGQFYVGAMFGFRPGEILVEGAGTSKALFRPLDVQRQGFLISDEEIAIDTSSARFGPGASIPLFDADGQSTEGLRAIQRVLGQLKAGVDATQAFIDALMRLKLIERIDVSLSFDDGENFQLDGLYTVSRDALHDLDDAQVLDLFRSGHLQAAYTMTLSLNQVAVLAQRRNERLAAPL